MKEQRRVFQKINKIKEKTELATHKVELGLVDKIESKYKSLGNLDVGRFLSEIQKMTSDLKSAINKVGDLLDDAQAAVSGYRSMGDDDNAKLAERLRNDIKNDYDEIVFIYEKLNKI